MLVMVLFLSGCEKARNEEEAAVGAPVPVQLALRVGAEGPSVKGNPSVITEMHEVFRGLTDLQLIPFNRKGEIEMGDLSNAQPQDLPDITEPIVLFPSSSVQLARKTASALVYGCSPVEPDDNPIIQRHLNGALTPDGFDLEDGRVNVSSIRFAPVPIFNGVAPAAAHGIASILSEMASEASLTVDYWYYANRVWRSAQVSLVWDENIADGRLREYFKWFTNEGKLITGSGLSAEYMLTYLYRLLKDYVSYDATVFEHVVGNNHYEAVKSNGGTDLLTYADLYNGMRDALLQRFERLENDQFIHILEDDSIQLVNSDQRVWPARWGLPDGSAVIQWTGIRFEVAEETLDGVAPIASYCYPPDLRYFSNTTLSTSTSDRESSYTEDRTSWSEILSDYRGGKAVYSDTRAVALDEPLNYSCGMLVANVRAVAEELDAGPSSRVRVTGSDFPLTGVIVGGQRTLRYDFTPLSGKDYFLYDNCISGVYLTAQESAEFRTLVSQTQTGENIYFCLEFRNDSGSGFAGAEGNILPGCKFYLVGRIDLPEDDETGSVFQCDCMTRVNCLITSLSEAHNSIPDLEHPSLTMGVQVKTNWTQATSSYIVMY